METIAKASALVPLHGPQTYATYVDLLTPPVAENVESPSTPPAVAHRPTRANSLWFFEDAMSPREEDGHNASASDYSLSTMSPLTAVAAVCGDVASTCGDLLGDLRHFNVTGLRHVRNALAHCDFRSVPVPEITYVFNDLRAARRHWQAILIDVQAHGETSADISYADVDYPPRRHNFLPVALTVDPSATRVKRVYTDADAENWGP